MPFTEKQLTVHPPIALAGRRVKRYHVASTDKPLEPAVEQAAYAFLPRLLPEPDETPPATFVVVHRGATGAYVNAYSWVWGNVIECRTAAAGEPVVGCDDTDPTNFKELSKPWIGCVWELPPLAHERSAWVRHMLEPDVADLEAYLADRMPAGPVGGGS